MDSNFSQQDTTTTVPRLLSNNTIVGPGQRQRALCPLFSVTPDRAVYVSYGWWLRPVRHGHSWVTLENAPKTAVSENNHGMDGECRMGRTRVCEETPPPGFYPLDVVCVNRSYPRFFRFTCAASSGQECFPLEMLDPDTNLGHVGLGYVSSRWSIGEFSRPREDLQLDFANHSQVHGSLGSREHLFQIQNVNLHRIGIGAGQVKLAYTPTVASQVGGGRRVLLWPVSKAVLRGRLLLLVLEQSGRYRDGGVEWSVLEFRRQWHTCCSTTLAPTASFSALPDHAILTSLPPPIKRNLARDESGCQGYDELPGVIAG
ncbi:hypothetical protein BaRGS_00013288 [Batillaria attramentaria]|uniref:Uncharacterized protein n=1 Tax=Batillaria attramentaria TaxID=370345 RepID=A0ABD0L8B7_9CAEN